ncbi:hypothetical protein OG217_13330 [Streptomyces sp. NBC_01023]|uniref:hypothetical protein n=1 Tax=Streptomyces sp. NBC_01023 TaxID=2903724 RepID=UPI0038662EC4|nr:hypothetical protein OG217_13330 [Streptomyces sp. NBC_01023]
MASTEPESNSEVSAAADTSEEAAPGAGTQTETEKRAEAETAKSTAVTLAGGVIGAEVPAATRVTESKATTLEPAPAAEPVAAEKPEPQRAKKAEKAGETEEAEKPGAASEPAPERASEATPTPATEPEATATPATAPATTAATTSRGIPALTAVLGTLTRSRTRTRTSSGSTAAVSAAGGNGPGGTGAEDDESTPGKVSRPMVAAAAIGGVVLLSLPFVVASFTGGDGPKHNTRNTAAGYTDPGAGADGYVPQSDASKAPLGKGGSKGPGGSGPVGGVNAPPIHEAASADTSGGPGATKTDGHSSKSTTGSGSSTDKGKTGTKTDSSSGSGTSNTSNKTTSSPKVLYSAIGGMHCSNSSVTYTEHGKYTDDQKGWTTHNGSYASGGCEGWYRSIPMSGDSSDSDNSAVWNFRTGDVKSGSCKVSVYIPNDSNVGHVGGQPTYYTVHDGTSTAGDTQLGHFEITQVSHRGEWIAAPSYQINSGVLSVKLHDRGDDWSSSSRANAHNASAAIKVECTA